MEKIVTVRDRRNEQSHNILPAILSRISSAARGLNICKQINIVVILIATVLIATAPCAAQTATNFLGRPVPPGAQAAANPLKRPAPRAAQAATSYTYTTLGTNGYSAYPSGINNAGQVVGTYGCCDYFNGFLYSGGSYTTIDVPGVSTIPYGINDAGQIVGWTEYNESGPSRQGFLYIGGTFTPIIEPGMGDTEVYGINNAGQMVGRFNDKTNGAHGFLLSGGVFTTIDVPGATYTYPSGINNAGQIVGYFADAGNYHGFLLKGGIFTRIDDPSAATYGTIASGINDEGQIVGYYFDASAFIHGFLLSGKTFTTIDTPGSLLGTRLFAINNAGQIVGANYDSQLGFLATPSAGAATAKNLGDCHCSVTSAGTAEGNPINAGTGNKYQAETDFAGGAATGLSLTRTYNSADATRSAFGSKWHGTWHRWLVAAFGLVTVTRADGRQDIFTNNGSGVYTADPDVTGVLTPVPATGTQTGWQLVTADDTVENYTLAGLLSTVTTRAGLVTSLTYDGNNNLIKVTGPFGHKLTFVYDANNRVRQMTGPDGGVFFYAYDANNNLISVTYPDAAVRRYVYENTSFPNALTGIIDEKGNRFATWAYDSQGRATSSQHAGGVDLTKVAYNSDGTTSVTDARGNVHGYTLTTQFGLVKPTAMTGAPVQSAGGKAFTYDANGFIAGRTDYDGNVTTYTHDSRGDETSRVEASGTTLARTISTTWLSTFHLPAQIRSRAGTQLSPMAPTAIS